jgi:WD40 repeat protein
MSKSAQPDKPVVAPIPASALPIDPAKTHQIAEFQHNRPLTHCRVDLSGRFVFAGAEDLNVHRWDLQTGGKTTLTGHESWVRSMDFSPDGRWLYTAGWDGRVGIWEVDDDDAKPARMMQTHSGACRWVRCSPDGSMLATCGNDLLVKIWNAADGKLITQMAGHKRHPYAVAFHPGGRQLVSEDLMGVIKVWSIPEGKELRTIDASVMTGYDNKFAADMGGARDMQFDAAGNTVACAGITNVKNSFAGVQDPIIVLVDWKTAKVKQQLRAAKNFQGIAWGVRFHADGFVIGVGADRSSGGAIWFWKPDQPAPFHTVSLKKGGRGLDILPDARWLAVPHHDGYLRLYQMTAKSA